MDHRRREVVDFEGDVGGIVASHGALLADDQMELRRLGPEEDGPNRPQFADPYSTVNSVFP